MKETTNPTEVARKTVPRQAWKDLKYIKKAPLLSSMSALSLLETVEAPEKLTKAQLLDHLQDQINWIDRHLEEKAAANNTTRLADDISEFLGLTPIRKEDGNLAHGLDANPPSWNPVDENPHGTCQVCYEPTPTTGLNNGMCSGCDPEATRITHGEYDYDKAHRMDR